MEKKLKVVGVRAKLFWVGKGVWFSYFEFVKGKVFIKKKAGVLDPEGATIQKALLNLGYKQVGSVRSGRVFEVELATENPKEAEEKLSEMARKLLANPVIEEFRVELEDLERSRKVENGPSTKLPSATLGIDDGVFGE